MKTHRTGKGPCNGCVFHLQTCTAGHNAYKQGGCTDFVPLCLNCHYPDIFCATCSMRLYSRLKPLPQYIPDTSRHRYACTW